MRISRLFRVCLGLVVALTGLMPMSVRPTNAQMQLATVARYRITDLGALTPAGSTSRAFGLNASGQVVGVSSYTHNQAFTWKSGKMAPLPIPSDDSEAYGINNSGQVVGSYSPDGLSYHAYFYSNGTTTDLKTLPGHVDSGGAAINSSSQVVGTSAKEYAASPRAFLWSKSGGMINLGTLPDDDQSHASDINTSGQVVGTSAFSRYPAAFLWTKGAGMINLGNLGEYNSQGYAINDLGQVVGYSTTKDGEVRAFLWTKSGGIKNLGTLSGYVKSIARDINGSGQVVGAAYTSSDKGHSFIWSKSGGMTDLNKLIPAGSGWVLENATSINDAGQIVGWGAVNGKTRAYLLTDIQAPATRAPLESLVNGSSLGASTVPVKLAWSATDSGSAVARYQLQQSTNGSSYSLVSLPSATTTSITRSLAPGTYRFRVRAQDRAGNWSAWNPGASFIVETHGELSSSITYPVGAWPRNAVSGAFGGYVKHESVSGSKARFTIAGNSLAWVSTGANNRGRADVYEVNPSSGALTKLATVDFYSSSQSVRRIVFTKTWATVATRTIEVRVLGAKNTASAGKRVDVDAFVRIRRL